MNSDTPLTLQNFVNLAKNYCRFIETTSTPPFPEYLKLVQNHLLQLYLAAMQLPQIELNSETDYIHDLTVQKDAAWKQIANTLGKYQYYWVKFNPVETDNEPLVCGDLTDDLLDIYSELLTDITTWELGTDDSKHIAAYNFKFNFEIHWGFHCINALYSIHYFIKQEN